MKSKLLMIFLIISLILISGCELRPSFKRPTQEITFTKSELPDAKLTSPQILGINNPGYILKESHKEVFLRDDIKGIDSIYSAIYEYDKGIFTITFSSKTILDNELEKIFSYAENQGKEGFRFLRKENILIMIWSDHEEEDHELLDSIAEKLSKRLDAKKLTIYSDECNKLGGTCTRQCNPPHVNLGNRDCEVGTIMKCCVVKRLL